MKQENLSNNKLNITSALLWACFLGSSWTWVIGMFLPVLLWRDYGLAGWIIFAVPNVIGAALMAFVLSTPEQSEQLVQKHRIATLLFSKVTIAFQIFAGIWILYSLIGISAVLAGAVVTLFVWLYSENQNSTLLKIGACTMIASIVLFILWLAFSKMGWSVLDAQEHTRLSTTDLALFAPASFLGFFLCPYLDLTFHRARQNTNAITGKVAFVIGFGIFFAAMIVFSLLYSSQLGKQLLIAPENKHRLTALAAFLIGIQIFAQAGFTTGIHLNEITNLGKPLSKIIVAAFALIALALAIVAIAGKNISVFHINIGEIIYRCFLIFYGLVFPAYVWLVMIPTRKVHTIKTRKTVWIISTIICLPMAFLFIVMSWSWWIIGMLAILLIARAFLEVAPNTRMVKSN